MKQFDENRKGTGTHEWSETTFNIQRGCTNDCLYCYAAHNAVRFKQRDRCDWAREELTKNAHIATFPKRQGVIMAPSSHDITPFNVEAFIRAARVLLEKGNRLLIVSKPRRECMKQVMDGLGAFRDQIQFRFTIGAIDERLTSFWEPGAPHPLERLDTLSDADARGFNVSVSIEPMLAGCEETLRVVENVLPWNPETVWIGKMNQPRRRVDLSVPENLEAVLRIERLQRDEAILWLVDQLKDCAVIRWKDSVKEVIGRAK